MPGPDMELQVSEEAMLMLHATAATASPTFTSWDQDRQLAHLGRQLDGVGDAWHLARLLRLWATQVAGVGPEGMPEKWRAAAVRAQTLGALPGFCFMDMKGRGGKGCAKAIAFIGQQSLPA